MKGRQRFKSFSLANQEGLAAPLRATYTEYLFCIRRDVKYVQGNLILPRSLSFYRGQSRGPENSSKELEDTQRVGGCNKPFEPPLQPNFLRKQLRQAQSGEFVVLEHGVSVRNGEMAPTVSSCSGYSSLRGSCPQFWGMTPPPTSEPSDVSPGGSLGWDQGRQA